VKRRPARTVLDVKIANTTVNIRIEILQDEICILTSFDPGRRQEAIGVPRCQQVSSGSYRPHRGGNPRSLFDGSSQEKGFKK
jgi:hypothetical protein